jgi:hypothetical protein
MGAMFGGYEMRFNEKVPFWDRRTARRLALALISLLSSLRDAPRPVRAPETPMIGCDGAAHHRIRSLTSARPDAHNHAHNQDEPGSDRFARSGEKTGEGHRG